MYIEKQRTRASDYDLRQRKAWELNRGGHRQVTVEPAVADDKHTKSLRLQHSTERKTAGQNRRRHIYTDLHTHIHICMNTHIILYAYRQVAVEPAVPDAAAVELHAHAEEPALADVRVGLQLGARRVCGRAER